MTFTGKILTVATLVFALIFAAMTVVVFATHRNWADEARKLQAEYDALKTLNDTYILKITAYQERLKREEIARRITLAALETERTFAQEQATNAVSENQVLTGTVASMANKNATDTTLLNTYSTENRTLLANLTQEQLSRDTQYNSYVSIVDQLHENQGLQNQLTARNSELAERSAQYKDVIDRLGPAATTAQELPLPLDGIVVAVGRELVEVSVGSDDGLKVGHTLDVFRRGGVYLGRIEVKKTLPDRSVAEILPEFRKGPIRIQDRVATRFIE